MPAQAEPTNYYRQLRQVWSHYLNIVWALTVLALFPWRIMDRPLVQPCLAFATMLATVVPIWHRNHVDRSITYSAQLKGVVRDEAYPHQYAESLAQAAWSTASTLGCMVLTHMLESIVPAAAASPTSTAAFAVWAAASVLAGVAAYLVFSLIGWEWLVLRLQLTAPLTPTAATSSSPSPPPVPSLATFSYAATRTSTSISTSLGGPLPLLRACTGAAIAH